ncbi:MAG: hypothetical protein Kow0074_24120 [Candidatus Zixiibacteriota bacterium]
MARNGKSSSKQKTPPKPEGPSIGATEGEEQSPFRYLIKGERVRRDGAFFELLLARVVLEPGQLNDFDNLWPRGTQALAGLNLRHLSKQSVKEMAEAVNSVGGEFTQRLHERAKDLVIWARAFWEISQIYGSFRQYVRSFDPDGPEALIEDLSNRLEGLSPKFLIEYLRESGEKIPTLAQFERVEEKVADKTQRQPRGQEPRRSGRGRSSGRRRGGRGRGRGRNNQPQTKAAGTSQEKKQEAPAADKPAKDAGSGGAGGGKPRNGRRGFFRKRRGGRGKKSPAGNGPKSDG